MLLVCTEPAIWLKMALPLVPLSCTGAVASQLKDNAKKIKAHTTKFLIFVPQESFNPLGLDT
jgi:hypothetical protein